MEGIEMELPDSMHRKMKYARDYLRILNDTGQLTDAKWGVLEEIAETTPGFSELLYPMNTTQRLRKEAQLFNAQDPSIPLIWQVYS